MNTCTKTLYVYRHLFSRVAPGCVVDYYSHCINSGAADGSSFHPVVRSSAMVTESHFITGMDCTEKDAACMGRDNIWWEGRGGVGHAWPGTTCWTGWWEGRGGVGHAWPGRDNMLDLLVGGEGGGGGGGGGMHGQGQHAGPAGGRGGGGGGMHGPAGGRGGGVGGGGACMARDNMLDLLVGGGGGGGACMATDLSTSNSETKALKY